MFRSNACGRAIAPRPELPRHIGILNDYVRIPYANGSSFASQFLYREFTRRGHDVTVLGPREPGAENAELPRRTVLFDSVPLSNHPGVFLAMPSSQSLARAAGAGFDVLLAQTGSGLLDLGVWLRAGAGVPLLCVNTIHLPSVYNVLLPDALNARADVTEFFDEGLIPRIERLTASAYNQSDGLIVLSEGLERYWRERGVTVPIHVIPRAVDPSLFD
ncbi:MAG TPA: glycosyltransferase, partial [Polyangiaceae bacterium]